MTRDSRTGRFDPSRRTWMTATAATMAAWATASSAAPEGTSKPEEAPPAEPTPPTSETPQTQPTIHAGEPAPGSIRHSLVHWCYANHFGSFEALCEVAKRLGILSIELCHPAHWPTLKKHGLSCAIASSHGFTQGLCRVEHHDRCIAKLTEVMTLAAEAGVPNVITFTGFAHDPSVTSGPLSYPIDRDEGLANCVTALKTLAPTAERLGVTLALEMLNTRDPETMKGHPGYLGDSIDECYQICQTVGSERVGLLFDLYHVQIMHGDLIRRIGQCADAIAHVHTAGNPGRHELDDNQEIAYRPVMAALVKAGYRGFVGHEFMPTRDAEQGLAEAVRVCTVPG